ncbi:hypothetical protein VaNZ11_011652 [Volvox africanus]|uniref:Uncharacterized protein n=1 Tax=Volvox africanus TaxID=51714 RepID=A0ABQ5SCU6_9CHLO|nr:hypothetical protein VaNZ11_011652 [Volvox africanus]
MEYAEYDTEVRFAFRSYRSSYDEPDSPPRSRTDPDELRDGDVDSEPGILGTLTSLLVGGVTELLTDFSPHVTNPPVERYASSTSSTSNATNTNTTVTSTSSPISASSSSRVANAHRRGSRPRSPKPSHGPRGDAGWNSLVSPGSGSRQRASPTASAAPLSSSIASGIGGKAASNRNTSSRDGGDEGEDSGWMIPPQRRSQPMATPAAVTRSRESDNGDMAPANSLMGSPTAGGSSGGLLGAMFSGISSLGQRATDILTQLDHDFETIFNGALEEEQENTFIGADSDNDPRVRPVDQSHRRAQSNSGSATGTGIGTSHQDDGRSGVISALGKDSSWSGTLQAASGGAGISAAQKGPVGGWTVGAEGASTAGKPPLVGRQSTARSAGGSAAASGGRGGSAAAGRSRQQGTGRFAGGSGGDFWNKQSDDDDNWGWGSSESETGPIAGSSEVAVVVARQSPATTRTQQEPVAANTASMSPPAGLQSLVVPGTSAVSSAATPSSSLPRNGRNVGGAASVSTSAASLTSPSSVRSSRSSGGKLFIKKTCATAASANAAADRASTAASLGNSATSMRPMDASSSTVTHGSHSVSVTTSPKKAAAKGAEPAPAAVGTAVGSVKSAVTLAAASAKTESHTTTSGSQVPPPGPKQVLAGSPKPRLQVRQTQPTLEHPGASMAAAAAAAETKAVAAAAAATSAAADGAAFLAEAKAAAAAMAASAASTQRDLRQQLDEARRCADAAEARCTELQQQLEAAEAETARLKSLTEVMQTQLEASQLRFEALIAEHTHLRATNTAAAVAATHPHAHHNPHTHHRHHPVYLADAACSPTRTGSPAAALSPPPGWAPGQGPAGRQGSGGNSRRPSISGGGSDELVEATLVAQLTAALADKARLWRENDILTRQLEGLQELLTYTAQQASYAHDGDGCSADDDDHYIMDAAAHDTYDTPYYTSHSGATMLSTGSPLPSVVLETAAEPTLAAGAGLSLKSPISYESAGAFIDLLYDMGDGGRKSGGDKGGPSERGAEERQELPYDGVGARGDGDNAGGGSTAGDLVHTGDPAARGRLSVACDASTLLAGVCSAAGVPDAVPDADADADASGATQMSSESPGCGSQRPERSFSAAIPHSQEAQPRRPAWAPNHQNQQLQKGDMQEARLGQMEMDQQRAGQQQLPPLPLPLEAPLLLPPLQQQDEQQNELTSPVAKPPVRTGSYPDGWEVLDEQGEVVGPQQQGGGGSEGSGDAVRIATVRSGGVRR